MITARLFITNSSPLPYRTLTDPNNFSYSSTDDRSLLDSVDKYKHLEDTPFKRQFLSVLSGSIQSTLEKAVRVNSVSVEPIYAIILLKIFSLEVIFQKLQRNRTLDIDVLQQCQVKSKKPAVRNMFRARMNLPAFNMQSEILYLINNYPVVLISGETGHLMISFLRVHR